MPSNGSNITADKVCSRFAQYLLIAFFMFAQRVAMHSNGSTRNITADTPACVWQGSRSGPGPVLGRARRRAGGDSPRDGGKLSGCSAARPRTFGVRVGPGAGRAGRVDESQFLSLNSIMHWGLCKRHSGSD